MPRHVNSGSFKKGHAPKVHFEKGHVPWNRGVSMHLSQKTEIRPGQWQMEKHPSWKGGVQHHKNDAVYIIVKSGIRVRRPRLVLERAHGRIPAGFIVYHIDGDKDNDELVNLVAISRKDAILVNCKLKLLVECARFPA